MNPNKLDSHDSNGEINCFAKKKQLITSGMTRVVMISIVKVTIIINTNKINEKNNNKVTIISQENYSMKLSRILTFDFKNNIIHYGRKSEIKKKQFEFK
jgi:hypothetical protein